MPKYNIYRIPKAEEEALVEKLHSVNLEQTREVATAGYRMRFFYSRIPDEVDIWWARLYEDFLQIANKPRNQVYFATLLVSNDHVCYGVSLGKSHFYLRQFCEYDFGLRLAERISDPEDIRIKNAKFFNRRVNKSITTYQQGTEIDYESAESLHFLKSATIDRDTWGKTASFGTSVLLNLPKVAPMDLPDLLSKIEAELDKPSRVEIPKAQQVVDKSLIAKLDSELADALTNSKGSSLTVDEFTLSGVSFVFSDDCTYGLYVNRRKREILKPVELSLAALQHFVNTRKVDLATQIDDLRVEVESEGGRPRSERLKCFLDYVSDDYSCCLIDGKWHEFNPAYVKFLSSQVDRIESCYESQFDLCRGHNGALPCEDAFNNERVESDGFINLHKKVISLDGKTVEWADLYKDGKLYFVKIGVPQDFAYLADQSLNTIKILQNTSDRISVDGVELSVQHVCLWMVMDRKKKLAHMSDVKSLILLMKIADWARAARDASYTPLIRINYVI